MRLFRRKFKNHLKFKDSVPTVLTILASGGVIFTAVAAIHDTPKALKIIKNEEDDRKFRVKVYSAELGLDVEKSEQKELTLMEKVKLVWKCYIPTACVASFTIFCIIKSNEFSIKQKKELIAAYGLLNAGYLEYRNKVKETIGLKEEAAIRDDICRAHIENTEDYDLAPNEVIFIDDFLKVTFVSTKEDVLAAEYELNRTFALRGYVSMGDFYRYLGLDELYAEDGPLFERFGWSYDMGTDMGYEWIDFNHRKLNDGEQETYEISYPFEPVLGYLY